MKSFKQFLEEELAKEKLKEDGTGGTGAVAANVSGNTANMAMPPDMGKKVLVKRDKKIA